MVALDGNSIGGLLLELFGTEMTAAQTICATCGAVAPVAETVVYLRAPGTVVRCRTCGSVLMVFVQAHGVTCVDLAGLASMSQPEPVLFSERDTRRPVCPNEQTGECERNEHVVRRGGASHNEPSVHAAAPR